MSEKSISGNYIRNVKTSRGRTVRIEVMGDVEEAERHFLDGISLFTAGTLTRNDIKHTTYISEMMSKLVRHIVKKLRGEKDEDQNKE